MAQYAKIKYSSGVMTVWSTIGHFSHGLVFFSLSLIVTFLRYRSQRVVFTRQLGWLIAFAIGEALLAWVPLLDPMLPDADLPTAISRAVLTGISYSILFGFGLQGVLSTRGQNVKTLNLMIILQAVWMVLFTLTFLAQAPAYEIAARNCEMFMRIGFGFPGGLLTAIGLSLQSRLTLEQDLRHRIRGYLREVEFMFAVFGVLSLVLTAPLSTVLNLQTFAPWFGWVWALVGAGITVGLSRSLSSIQFALEQWVEDVERLQALAVDRERIGRELHDGIIQSIYAVGLLIESIMPIIPTDPTRAQSQLGRVMESLNTTIQDIRRYIFDLRSDMADDTIPAGVERLLRDFRVNTLLETDLEISGEQTPILSIERRRHIFQIVREALTNTAKHARARWVKVYLVYNEHTLDLVITDDGIGMETLQVSKGYGLRNIRERARMLDGTLRIESAPGEGVTFQLTVPY